MSKMVTELSALLLKQQTTFGTAVGSLDSTNGIETIGAAELSYEPDMTEIALVANGFDQDPAVPGAGSYEISAKAYMRTGNAASSYGQIETLLLASGMVSSGASTIRTYNFTSTRSAYKDYEAWAYSGDKSASGSLLRKMNNIVFKPKWTLEAGKPTVMEVSGMAVTQGSATSATMPSITKTRVSPPALLGASSLIINGSTNYKLLKMEIDPNQETNLTLDPTATYGRGKTAITNRKIKWTATVYQDVTGTVNPEQSLLAKTEGSLVVGYGTAPNKITFSSGYAQITDVKPSDDSGVQTWELSGQINRTDFAVILDTTA